MLKEWITLLQWINRCPAIRKTDVLSFGNLDKTPIKTLEFDAREFSSIVDCFYCSLRWRNKRSYILSAVVYILYCEALRFLAILSIVWEKFLKSRNAEVIWQSADEAYRVNHSTVVACIETQVLGFLNILNSFCRILNLSRKKWNKPRPFLRIGGLVWPESKYLSCKSKPQGKFSAAQQQHADRRRNEAFTCFIYCVKIITWYQIIFLGSSFTKIAMTVKINNIVNLLDK